MADDPQNKHFLETLRAEFQALSAGARTPTIREVAAAHSVSQFAVQRAYEALKEEGLIQSFVGRGSFIVGGDDTGPKDASGDVSARILIVSHSTPSQRGTSITRAIQETLEKFNHKSISVSYSDVSDLHDLLGRGGFDICVLQPRRSILPVGALALLKSKAKHMIVEGRQLELMDVDIFVRNRAKSMAIAMRHLRELGHDYIGLLTERLDVAAGYGEIENLYTQFCGLVPNGSSEVIVRVASSGDEASTADEIAEALKAEFPTGEQVPTAFIVSGRFKPKDIEHGFASASLRIPDEVSVVHLRALPETSPDEKAFTTVGRTAEHVANGIVDVVNWRLSNQAEPTGLILDDPTLEQGFSTQRIGTR